MLALFHSASQAAGLVKMKLNAYIPATVCQKLTKVSDEQTLGTFFEKFKATEVTADALGEERKGHVVRISGNDKPGFPMKRSSSATAEYVCCCVGGVLVTDQGKLDRGSSSLSRCIVDANLGVSTC